MRSNDLALDDFVFIEDSGPQISDDFTLIEDSDPRVAAISCLEAFIQKKIKSLTYQFSQFGLYSKFRKEQDEVLKYANEVIEAIKLNKALPQMPASCPKDLEKIVNHFNFKDKRFIFKMIILELKLNQVTQPDPAFKWCPIESLLNYTDVSENLDNFSLADEMWKQEGHPLPNFYCSSEYFKSLAEVFRYFSYHYHDLYIALRKKPDLINQVDENGMTLWHHAAKIGFRLSTNRARLILHLLFSAYEDQSVFATHFSTQDNKGNTPLHLAAQVCNDKTSCYYIFPTFIAAAIAVGFDFDLKNNEGKTVMDIFLSKSYLDEKQKDALLIKIYNSIEKNSVQEAKPAAEGPRPF